MTHFISHFKTHPIKTGSISGQNFDCWLLVIEFETNYMELFHEKVSFNVMIRKRPPVIRGVVPGWGGRKEIFIIKPPLYGDKFSEL